EDGGASWRLLRKGLFGVVETVAIDPQGALLAHFPEEGLVLARNGKAARPVGLKHDRVKALVARAEGGWIAALDDDGVLPIGADGKPEEFLVAGLDATRVTALAAGAAPGQFWAGDRNGVFFSADGARSWVPREQGLGGAPVSAFLWHGEELFLGTEGAGVFRWDPGQQNWQGRSGGLGTSNTIFSLARDRAGRYLYVATEGGILRSDDAGQQWTKKNAGLPPAGTWKLAASPTVPGRVWAAGAGDLFRSDDGGDTWAATGVAVNPAVLAAGLLEGHEVLWLAENRGLWVVEGNAGRRWPVELAADERLEAVVPGTAALWLGSSKGLWSVAADGGRKLWEGAGVLSVLPAGADGVVLAGTDGRGVARFRLQ
ncbi:MAG: hypothetical protein P1P84_08890, partial [Deferrisomatales bacterium]|nr:hypothetical protein [Deferrisomatales bacterium]